jgi:hypothetical protein
VTINEMCWKCTRTPMVDWLNSGLSSVDGYYPAL